MPDKATALAPAHRSEHPYAATLLTDLLAANVRVLAYRVP
jgi:hypothetical protein